MFDKKEKQAKRADAILKLDPLYSCHIIQAETITLQGELIVITKERLGELARKYDKTIFLQARRAPMGNNIIYAIRLDGVWVVAQELSQAAVK